MPSFQRNMHDAHVIEWEE